MFSQLTTVCEQLKNVTELADGFNAIGFSQGGLFLRAYVEKCNHPSVKKLMSFGSPHMGMFVMFVIVFFFKTLDVYPVSNTFLIDDF